MSFVVDSFADADGTDLTAHTGAAGATWTQHPSAGAKMWISGNKCMPKFSNFSYAYASGVPAGAEYDVEAILTVMGTDFSVIGLCARMDTSADTYYVAYGRSDGTWRMYEVIAGVATQIGTVAETFDLSDVFTLKFEVRDASKKLYVNGVAVITDTTHNNITGAGRAGVYGYNSAGGGDLNVLALSSFIATNAAPAVTPPTPGFSVTPNLKLPVITDESVTGTNPITSVEYAIDDEEGERLTEAELEATELSAGTHTIYQFVNDGVTAEQSTSQDITTETRYRARLKRRHGKSVTDFFNRPDA